MQPLYAQVVIDMEDWQQWLPKGIEAVWYLSGGNCHSGGSMQCEQTARRVHASLLQKFKLTKEQLPLLTFDPFAWGGPFREAK